MKTWTIRLKLKKTKFIFGKQLKLNVELLFLTFQMRIDYFLLYPMRSMGESMGIGLEASSASKGPQAKTTEPMDPTKVTYCSIQLG